MRRGAEVLVLAVGLMLGSVPAAAQAPEAVEEDVAAAVAELEALGQPPTAAEMADLLNERAGPRPRRRWAGEGLLRWQRTAAGLTGREAAAWAAGPAWDLRLRARQSTAGETLTAGSVGAGAGPLTLRAGGWTWREGFGLLVGGAGRTGGIAADAGLGPGGGGPRGWTGWPDPRAARGLALGLAAGGWEGGGAWGQTGEGGATLAVATVGRRSGLWRLVAVNAGDGAPAGGANGRWRQGSWSGAWELALFPGAPSAAAAHVRWSGGRRWGAEALAAVVPRGATGPSASSLPLLGTDAGSGGALRVSWRPGPGAGLSALVAAAARDEHTSAAPARRLTSDILGQAPLAADLLLSARLRTAAGTATTWDQEWPWAPPQTNAARRTQALSLALEHAGKGPAWRLLVRSLAVDHSATSGRRTLIGAELRSPAPRRLNWQLTWRWVWGDPVDLADAVCPLPGLVVPRHLGQWSGAWFGRIGWTAGPWRLDAAVDLRTAALGGRALECWLGSGARW